MLAVGVDRPVPGAGESRDARGAGVAINGLVGCQHKPGVVDARHLAEIVFEALLPVVPGFADIGFNPVFQGVRTAKARPGCWRFQRQQAT
jgi:hypothetical protein